MKTKTRRARAFLLQTRFLFEEQLFDARLRRVMSIFSIVTSFLIPISLARAENSPETFFRGKQIHFVIGYAAASGYDVYARLLAEYLPRHIPGRPVIVPENMPGAGSLVAANYLYHAPQDGTYIGAIDRSLVVAPLLETVDKSTIKFDPRRFTWIGSMSSETTVGFVHANKAVATFDDLKRHIITTGTASVTSDGYMFSNLLNRLLGTKLKIILGYQGTNEVYTAIDRGELDGYIGGTLTSLLAGRPAWLTNGDINMLIQISLKKDPRLPNTPIITDFAKSDAVKSALELILSPQQMGRPYLAPPGVPADRALALQTAFDETMMDPEFVAAARKLQINVSPMSGVAIERLLIKLYQTPQSVQKIASDALAPPVAEKKSKN